MRILMLMVVFVLWLGVPAQGGDFELTQTQEGIHLKAIGQPLSRVLQSVGEKSGIAFYLREELYPTPVNVDLQAPDWRTLVGELLRDFSKVETWKEDVVGSKIRITGLGDYVPPSSESVASRGPRVITVPRTQPRPDLSVEPRRRPSREARSEPPPEEPVDPNHPLAKLPAHIVMEPGILNYLVQSGAEIPEPLRRKYGIDPEHLPKNYPIPPHIYNAPEFEEYLQATGLPKPPQFPNMPKPRPGGRNTKPPTSPKKLK